MTNGTRYLTMFSEVGQLVSGAADGQGPHGERSKT